MNKSGSLNCILRLTWVTQNLTYKLIGRERVKHVFHCNTNKVLPWLQGHMSIRRFVFLFFAGEVDTRFSFCAVACLSLLVSFSLFCMFMFYIYVYVYGSVRVQELCESQGGRPGLSVLTSLTVSVDVKQHWTVLRHWSQFVPNMSTDIRGREALLHHMGQNL